MRSLEVLESCGSPAAAGLPLPRTVCPDLFEHDCGVEGRGEGEQWALTHPLTPSPSPPHIEFFENET